MKSKLYADLQSLQAHGYEITKSDVDAVRPNHGSETLKHRTAKMSTAHVLWNNGFRVASEVERDGRYADIVGLGCEGRMPVIVELETNATDSDRELYRELYGSSVVQEVFTINVSDLSTIPDYQTERIADVLGL